MAITEHEVWVIEDDGRIIGFHRVSSGEPAVLEDLWLEPEAIGGGHGRRLWEHAARVARAGGASTMELDAEPNALGFYERMGAVRVGVTASPVVQEVRRRLAARGLPGATAQSGPGGGSRLAIW